MNSNDNHETNSDSDGGRMFSGMRLYDYCYAVAAIKAGASQDKAHDESETAPDAEAEEREGNVVDRELS